MKKICLLLLPLLAAACGQGGRQASVQTDEPVRVMTFNIRYDNPADSLDNWAYRKDRAAKAIRFYDADIVGTQEVLHNQLEDLRQRLPSYEVIGVGREDGKEKGEYSALWYRKDRFTAKESGWFWLSETPEVAGSKGWDGACERIATWARLQDKQTGKECFVLNTHLDHVGVEARKCGVKLVLDKVQELGGDLPVIVTGDFNAEPESGVIKQVTSLVATISLAEFLRSFGKDGRPFGRGQSVRLAVAGSLIVLSTLLDLFTPALTWSIRLVDGSAPVNISTQPGIDPMMVSLAVFFACLAIVVRYGNALKEDSDSIA